MSTEQRHILRLPVRFPFTFAAATFAIMVITAAVVGDINRIWMPVEFLGPIEHSEMAEVLTSLLLVVLAVLVDGVVDRRMNEEKRQQAERLRVARVTIRTVQDIVNNGLNQLLLVRFEAEGHVSAATLATFDEAIHDTATRLTALGELPEYREYQMANGVGLGTTPWVEPFISKIECVQSDAFTH